MTLKSKRGVITTPKAKAKEIWLGELKELETSLAGYLVNAATPEATEQERAKIIEVLSEIIKQSKELV